MITRRQIAFAVIYVFSFTTLAVIGYMVGDYSVRQKMHKIEMPSSVIAADTAFYDLPLMNLTVTSEAGNQDRIRIDMSLEVQKSDLPRLESYQPRIIDHLINYLRRQDIEALRQASNEHVFKSQLLEETNKGSYPVPVMDIVFRRFIVL